MAELVQLLKKVSLFRGLSSQQLEQIAVRLTTERYQAREVIINQDSPGTKMYIIGSGQVEIILKNDFAALILGSGQIFGEMALLDRGNRSATVRAVENDTTLYSIEEPEFTRFCTEDTAAGYIMMRNLALDLSIKIRHQNLDY